MAWILGGSRCSLFILYNSLLYISPLNYLNEIKLHGTRYYRKTRCLYVLLVSYRMEYMWHMTKHRDIIRKKSTYIADGLNILSLALKILGICITVLFMAYAMLIFTTN